MAHIRAVRQIVVTVGASQQRVEVTGFQRCLPRGVEHHRFGIELLELRSNSRECLVPRALEITVAGSVVAHWRRQAPLHLQVEVRQLAQLRKRMRSKEIGCAPITGQVPDCGLGAILAELEGMRLRGLAPCTGRAHVALRLVLTAQRVERPGRRQFPSKDLRHPLNRTKSSGGAGIVGRAVFVVVHGLLPSVKGFLDAGKYKDV